MTQTQNNKQSQNVRVVVNNNCAPAKKKAKRRPPPPPQPVMLPPAQPAMAMSSLGIQPFAARPVTYAPSSQMIIQENAPPAPAYFERAQTNVENTVTQMRRQFQEELDDMRNELMAHQANTNQLDDIAKVAQAVQTSFDGLAPQSSSSTSSMPVSSLTSSSGGAPSQGQPSPMSYASAFNPLFDSMSEDTVQGNFNPFAVPQVPSSQGSTQGRSATHESGGGMSLGSGVYNGRSSSEDTVYGGVPFNPYDVDGSYGSHNPVQPAPQASQNEIQPASSSLHVSDVAGIPLPSSTVSAPISISSDSAPPPPVSRNGTNIRDMIYGDASSSESADNHSHVGGGLRNESPPDQAKRLYSEYNAYRDTRKRKHHGKTIRTLARSMGITVGDRERLDRIVKKIETHHQQQQNPQSSSSSGS